MYKSEGKVDFSCTRVESSAKELCEDEVFWQALIERDLGILERWVHLIELILLN